MSTLTGFSRRLGKIVYSSYVLEDNPEVIQHLYSKIIPLEVKFNYVENVFEVTAISPTFDLVQQGQIAPQYEVIAESIPGYGVGHRVDISFKRKP